MRGGLDDALDKLARRDELRRRAAGEATGTPPAVHDLVEAIATVVSRNPKLEVTVGVEGVGDPTLLHFYVEDGVVQVNADSTVAARATEATAPKHADFEVVVEEPVVAAEAPPQTTAWAPPYAEAGAYDAGEPTRRISYDDRDRYDPGTGYGTTPYGEPDPYTQPAADDDRYRSPFAATPPPPVPPQTTASHTAPPHTAPPHTAPPHTAPLHTAPHAASSHTAPPHAASSRTAPPPAAVPEPPRIRPEHYRAPEEATAAERTRVTAPPVPEQRGMPEPLSEPIPLHVDSAETEQAARRLSALLRENPSLLRPAD